jgi:hypothetical protein
MLAGLSPERIAEIGGTGDWEDLPVAVGGAKAAGHPQAERGGHQGVRGRLVGNAPPHLARCSSREDRLTPPAPQLKMATVACNALMILAARQPLAANPHFANQTSTARHASHSWLERQHRREG